MSKIAPEKQSPYRVIHIKDKPNILDFDKDGDVDFKDFSFCFKKQLKCVSYLYDVTLGNVPWLSIISLITTIISSSLIVSGINSSQNILAKYSYHADSLVNIYSLVLLGFILLDVCVLIQGLTLCGLETFREVQDKNKKKNLSCCFKCNRFTMSINVGLSWNRFNIIVIFYWIRIYYSFIFGNSNIILLYTNLFFVYRYGKSISK